MLKQKKTQPTVRCAYNGCDLIPPMPSVVQPSRVLRSFSKNCRINILAERDGNSRGNNTSSARQTGRINTKNNESSDKCTLNNAFVTRHFVGRTKRRAPNQHFVQQHTHRPPIGADASATTLHHFRRHIFGSTTNGPRSVERK